MLYTKQTKSAMSICYRAHKEQEDNAGIPYVFHPVHLAEQMETEEEICAALLHDVVEDTDITIEDLEREDFAPEIIEAVKLLTHDRRQPYMEYILGLKNNPLARKIKIEDLKHNSNYDRLNTIRPSDRRRRRKYCIALAILERDTESDGSRLMIKRIPLHDVCSRFLKVYYSPEEGIRKAVVESGKEAGERLILSPEMLKRADHLCRDGMSFPEMLAEYLDEHSFEELKDLLRGQGILFDLE